MNRRDFVRASVGLTGAHALAQSTPQPQQTSGPVQRMPFPVIDTHVHLFDTNRPQGVPWPPKENTALYKPALPERYKKLAIPHGVVGAIKVEASPLLEDNQWVIDLISKEPFFVGFVGNILPGDPDFARNLDRFHKSPLLLGIRYGNLWGSNLAETVKRKEVIDDLRRVAAAGLSLDTANPNPELVAAIVRVTDEIPNLRVVIDHLPGLVVPTVPSARRIYETHLSELHKRPQVFTKLSAIYRKIGNEVPRDLGLYRANLDQLFETFGEDRIVFGSDWPNSDNLRPYDDIFAIAQEYAMSKGPVIAEKYFWKNSVKAYKWVPRDASQPRLS